MSERVTRRRFLRLAGIGAVGALLAACGPAPTPQVIEKEVTKEVVKEVEKQVTAAPLTGSLQYFTYSWSPALEEMQRAKSQAFEGANPGTKVDVVVMPWEDIWTKSELAFSAGNPPDIIEYDFPAYTLFKKGILLNLTPYIQKDGELLDPKIYDQKFWEPYTFEPDGIYAVPERIAGLMIWLNMSLFKQAGLEYPNVDWTMDDFVALAKQLTVAKGSPDDVWGATVGEWTSWWGWMPLVWALGGELVDKAHDPTALYLDDPKVYGAVQWVADLVYKHQVAPNAAAREALVGGDFMSGKVAMVMNGDWWTETNKGATFEWDLHLLPKGPGGRTSGYWVYGVCISKGSKNSDLAWQYARFLAGDEVQRIEASYSAGVPFRLAVAQSSLFNNPTWAPKNLAVRTETLKDSRPGDVWHENWQAMISEVLDPEGTQPVFLGEKTAEETFRAIADKARQKLFGS